MGYEFLYALWFFLPAGMANFTPIFAARLPLLKSWNAPLDGHISYRGKRLFGASKTLRGFVSGVIVAVVIYWLQKKFAIHLGSFALYLKSANYAHLSSWLGVLLGIGALAGDTLESFFKRQLGVDPGKSWFPFDQVDYIVGGCLLSALVTRLPVFLYAWIALVWFLMHLLFSYIGYLLRLKDSPI